MNFGIPDKEQTQIKEAFSSLWEVCGNTWDRLFDDTSEEKIKELEKQVWDLEGEVQVLSEEREKLEKNK
mgnify:CR=1 FL=1|tara:strand:- start:74 stop:280 length:207 start_codon:yes stop_codon:yes gene_type:complete